MVTFKKKDLNELVGGDIGAGGSDRNPSHDSEIETGPVKKPFNDKSDYERGQSPTTDKVFARYRQDIPWFAVYSYGGTRNSGGVKTFENTVVKKKAVEEKIDDLVKKSKVSDVTDKNYNPKIDNLINLINSNDLSDKQIEELEKAINNKKTITKKTI